MTLARTPAPPPLRSPLLVPLIILSLHALCALACATSGGDYKSGIEPTEREPEAWQGDPYVRGDGPARERCEQSQFAQECHDEAREALRDQQNLASAAMILDQLCDQGRASACYDYALIIWFEVGVPYSPQEVQLAMRRAEALGDPLGAGPYDELLAGSASTAREGGLSAPARARFQDACALKLPEACSTLRGQSALPPPSSPQQPAQQPDPSSNL